MNPCKSQAVLLAAVVACIAPISALAQTSGTWVSPTGGTWTDAANWSSSPLVPGNGGTAVINPVTTIDPRIMVNNAVILGVLSFENPNAFTILGTGTIEMTGLSTIRTIGPVGPNFTSSENWIDVPMTGNSGLNVTGGGNVALESPLYTGQTNINYATLILKSATFGAANGTVNLNNGIVGFDNSSDPHTFFSPINVGDSSGTISTFRPGGTNVITFAAPIYGGGTITFASSGTISLTASSPFGGFIQTRAPTVLESGGAISDASTFLIRSSVKLVNDFSNGSVDRIGESVRIVLGSQNAVDMPSLLAKSSNIPGVISVAEKIGTLTMQASGVIAGDPLYNLWIARIERQNHSILTVGTGTADSGAFVRVNGTIPGLIGSGAEGTPQAGIVPWAQSWDFTPITVDSAGNFRQLTSSESVNAIPEGNSAANVILQESASISQAANINSLTLRTGSLSGSGTVRVASGRILLGDRTRTSNRPLISAPIDFGDAEGVIDGTTGTISGIISGTGGVTVRNVSFTNANTYTGPTTIFGSFTLGSSVFPNVPGPLGAGNDPVHVYKELALRGADTFARDVVLHQTAVIRNSGFWVYETGDVYVADSGAFADNMFETTGQFFGDQDSRFFASANMIVHQPSPQFFGTFSGNWGTLTVDADDAFGVGTFVFSNTLLEASGSARTLHNSISIIGRSFILGSTPITFTGDVSLGKGAGTLIVTNTATTTLAGSIGMGSFNKSGGGDLEVGNVRLTSASVWQGTLRVIQNGGSLGVSSISLLNIASGAKLDLNDNGMVIDYRGNSPGGSVGAWIASGMLVSSLADGRHGIGYADNADLGLTTFLGQPVDSTAVLIDYTYNGDANLDEKVDISDLFALASHWQANDARWSAGDYNYDGKVDVQDLTLLAPNWQAGVVGGANPSFSEALTSLGLPQVEVPEPTLLALIGIGAVFGLRTPRRRNVV